MTIVVSRLNGCDTRKILALRYSQANQTDSFLRRSGVEPEAERTVSIETTQAFLSDRNVSGICHQGLLRFECVASARLHQ